MGELYLENLEDEKKIPGLLGKMECYSNKTLLIAIFYTIIAVFFLCWAAFIYGHPDYYYKDLHDLIRQKEVKNGEFVKINVTNRPYVFAEFDSKKTSDKYYFIKDNEYLYIGYLNYDTYLKLNDFEVNSEQIVGVTKKISKKVLDIAISSYNEGLEEDVVTKDNYQSYIGEVYIDTTSFYVPYMYQAIIGFIFLLIAVCYYILYLMALYKNSITFKKTPEVVIEKVISELQKTNCLKYPKYGICLAENYLIDGSSGLILVAYSDIVWSYLSKRKIFSKPHLVILTNTRKKYKIAKICGINTKSKNVLSQMLEIIKKKNENIEIGYTKGNRKIFGKW